MTRVFLGWGALMATIFLVGLLFFGFGDPVNAALFGSTVVVMVAIAAVLTVSGLGRSLAGGARSLPDVSPPTLLLAVAIVVAVVGAQLGLWLALIGGGLGLLAVGGLVREARAQRRALRRAAPAPPVRRDGEGAA